MKSSESQHLKIHDWKNFSRFVRSNECGLLKCLNKFPRSILITGCQRSGTTMLSRVITQSKGMVNYWFGKDDELSAALILSGWVQHKPDGRYCFQTTYLNECVSEYINISKDHRIVWVLRNPFSVIYSLVYHWNRWALNELFISCGATHLSNKDKKRYELFGPIVINRLKKACLAYVGKINQLDYLRKNIGELLCVVDYDDLVQRKSVILPQIYKFIGIDYQDKYSDSIHSNSMEKKRLLTEKENSIVEQLCWSVYEQSRELLTIY